MHAEYVRHVLTSVFFFSPSRPVYLPRSNRVSVSHDLQTMPVHFCAHPPSQGALAGEQHDSCWYVREIRMNRFSYCYNRLNKSFFCYYPVVAIFQEIFKIASQTTHAENKVREISTYHITTSNLICNF